jgi:hypothetical protein
MAENLKVCNIDDALLARLKKFRFRKEKTNEAIVMVIDSSTMTIHEDTSFDTDELVDIKIDEFVPLLPEHEPRYIALSYCYKHDDGRTSYPLCFVFVSPQGCKPEMQMMYAGSKLSLVNAGGFSKTFELRSVEEFTEDWLIEKLKFFR